MLGELSGGRDAGARRAIRRILDDDGRAGRRLAGSDQELDRAWAMLKSIWEGVLTVLGDDVSKAALTQITTRLSTSSSTSRGALSSRPLMRA